MGDDMNKTKIDWCDSTWNPVTGCLHECEYCYAKRMAHRFSGGGENWTDDKIIVLDKKVYGEEEEKAIPYPYGFIPTFHKYRLNDYIGKKGRNIFVCSMADLFGEWVPDSWIEEVFKACENAPQHNYLFLTKNPIRYAQLGEKGLLPDSPNMWFGFSETKTRENPVYIPAGNIFVSIEPILEEVRPSLVDWVIVGAETGRRKDKVIPKKEWIETIVDDCKKRGVPLFMKSSLADIWGEPLIQEFPERLRRV